jgi:hypothetical protein
MRLARLLSALVLLAAPLAPIAAQQFTTLAPFLAAAHATGFVEYESFDRYAPDHVLPAGFTFAGQHSTATVTSWPDATLGRIDRKYFHYGPAGLALHDPTGYADFFLEDEGMWLAFDRPIYGLGVAFNVNPSPAGTYGVQTPEGSAGIGAGCVYWLCFAGLVSATPFTTAYVGGLGGGASGFTLDDLFWVVDRPAPVPVPETPAEPVEPTVTPEPASLMLVATGLVIATILLAVTRRGIITSGSR